MFRGIATKLIIYLTLMVIVVEGIFAFYDIKAQERQLLDEMTLNAELVSSTMVNATWDAMLEDRREKVYAMMRNVARQENIDKVRVFNKTGRIMFSTGGDEGEVVDTSAEACDLCHAVDQPLVQVDVPSRARVFRRPDRDRVLGMVTPIYNEPSCSQAACHAHPENISVLGVVDVTMPLARVDRQMAGLRFRSFLLAGVSVLVLSGFVFFFTRRFVQTPVRKLIAATQSVGVLDADEPLGVAADDEIGDLARSFTDMQERVRRSNHQLQDFNLNLERLVDERTRQLRATEQKLIQSDRLASLGQLAASVAHEINNPLGGVINFGKLMQRLVDDQGIPPGRVADFRTYLEHVVTETSRCGRIVRDLLIFARHSTPQRIPQDFNAIVQRTVSVLRHRLELGEVEPVLHLDEHLPEVTCDASQIQQIVTNLVINAAEAMEDGRVTICTRTGPAPGKITLAVSDTGSGIPPEYLSQIYDPFFSTKGEGQGTGLGLAVVYGIVESHGGQIDVATTVGKGTTFTVTLPIQPPPGSAPTLPANGSVR
ncbi:MAG: ATP-binding protein [Candidatus Krumholzibacteriia bacterium]